MTTTATSSAPLPPGYYVDLDSGAWCSLPWPSDPDEKMAIVNSSLGTGLIEWAEGRTDEPGLTDYQTGEPWRFTAGQKRFLLLWYLVNDEGRFAYRSGIKRGAKGIGKDPFGAAVCLGELVGPCQLDGWDDDGRPVGRRRGLPLVQIASNSEDQSKDVLRVANSMLSQDAREFYDIDCGETRTIIKGGRGRLEVVTASEKSSEGDPATFIMLNESHHMTEMSGGHRLAAVARRNVGKSPAEIQARLCEFTNAHMQGMDSVAEQSYEAWQAQLARGYRGKRDILYDSIEAPPDTDILSESGRLKGLRASYSDAPWADLERLADEMHDRRTSVADTIRFYLNGLAAAEDSWVDPGRFDSMVDGRPVEDGEKVAMFLDCSKSEDATGLVGCRISDGHVFVVDVWQRPKGWRSKEPWRVPRDEVDGRVRESFEKYRVVWFGVDPSPATDDDAASLYWGPLLDAWHRDFRKKLKLWATPGASIGHAVKFDMRVGTDNWRRRNAEFVAEAEATAHAVDEEESVFTHDGDARLRSHVHNAKRRPTEWGVSLGKVTRDSSKLVDLAVCMVGARLGRRLVLNSGKVGKTDRQARVVVL